MCVGGLFAMMLCCSCKCYKIFIKTILIFLGKSSGNWYFMSWYYSDEIFLCFSSGMSSASSYLFSSIPLKFWTNLVNLYKKKKTYKFLSQNTMFKKPFLYKSPESHVCNFHKSYYSCKKNRNKINCTSWMKVL